MPSAPSLEPDSAAIDSDIESDIESEIDAARVDAARIDPEELAIALRVLATLSEVDEEDPDFLTVRHATAKMFKSVKVSRRAIKRARI
ncbi:MAG: short-chain dehydrogenase, partial [Microterricola sp.]